MAIFTKKRRLWAASNINTLHLLQIAVIVWLALLLAGEVLLQQELQDKDKRHKHTRTQSVFWSKSSHDKTNAQDDSASQQTPLAWKIVTKAYHQTYAQLERICLPTQSFPECLTKVRHHQNKTWPWWFQTLLRDTSPPSPLHLAFHEVEYRPPRNMKVCTIEKVSSSSWRRLQCILNNMNDNDPTEIDSIVNTTRIQNRYQGKSCKPSDDQAPNENAVKVVIFRDPLERFLSAAVDKCLQHDSRLSEKHCQPNLLFAQEPEQVKEMEDQVTGYRANHHDIMADLTTYEEHSKHNRKLSLVQKRVLFDAYVDVMPLSWNVHFFPQGLYCDGLYRKGLADYDFVGYLGPRFYHDLNKIYQHFSNDTTFGKAFDFLFQLKAHLNTTFQKSRTSASQEVLTYYTPRTVRRVLEFYSLDYFTLGLPIPLWAEEILEQDENFDQDN